MDYHFVDRAVTDCDFFTQALARHGNCVSVLDIVLILHEYLLGSVVLDLEEIPLPFNNPDKIKDHHALVNRERGSLFEQRRLYGWWPVTGQVKVITGRLKKKKEKITKLTVKFTFLTMLSHVTDVIQNNTMYYE